jgi:RNA-directed DNA polymerase
MVSMEFLHTYKDIISLENLLLAWKEFRRGKRSRKDAQEFERNLMDHIISLHNDLTARTYVHDSYQHFKIADPKQRDIHKATVRDRLLHHALYRVLYLYFDTKFVHDSYSCRDVKGTHRALNRFTHFARKVSRNNTRTCWVLKCDIRKFFASIDHVILADILKKNIIDQDTIWLLERVIESFESTGRGKGLPLGNLTSQLLVNIYMNKFDQYVKHALKQKYYVRYADDFVFLSHDHAALTELLPKVRDFLHERLALTLHPRKVSLTTVASGIDFLGWVHFPDHRVLRTTTKRRMFRNILQKKGKDETVQSYLGLLRYGNAYALKSKIQLQNSVP